METYTIEATGQGGYEVRAAGTGDNGGQVIMSFPTRWEAQAWIDGQTRIAMKTANASDVA